MRNVQLWQETKFVKSGDVYVASRDRMEVGEGSRIIGDLQATAYSAALKRYAGGRLLDLGCGKVPLYGIYKTQVTDIYCVDWPASWHETQHLDVYANINFDLPFRSDCFDTIVMTDVLEHVRKPENLLREIFRVLSPNGKVIISCPFYYWIHESPHDYYRYTEFKFRDFAEQFGFIVLNIAAYGGPLEIIGDTLSKLFCAKKLYRLNALLIKLVKLASKVRKIREFSLDRAKDFPIGYVVIFQKGAAA